MDSKNYKEFLYDYCEDNLSKAPNGGYVCPCCENGSGQSGTGMLLNPKQNYETWKCFKCGEGGDIYSIVSLNEKIPMKEAFSFVRDKYKDEQPREKEIAKIRYRRAYSAAPKDNKDFYNKAYLAAMQDYGDGKDCYLKQRGFSEHTVFKYRLGLANYKERKSVIVPVNKEYFIARTTEEPWHLRTGDMKVLNPTGVETDFFNKQALWGDSPAFVVEGWADACSIYEATDGKYEGLSLNSCAYKGKLVELLKEHPTSSVIIALDGDKAGRDANEYLVRELGKIGINTVNFTYPEGIKDMNDWLVKDKKSLVEALNKAENIAIFSEKLKEFDIGDYDGENEIVLFTANHGYVAYYDIDNEVMVYGKDGITYSSIEYSKDDFLKTSYEELSEEFVAELREYEQYNDYYL